MAKSALAAENEWRKACSEGDPMDSHVLKAWLLRFGVGGIAVVATIYFAVIRPRAQSAEAHAGSAAPAGASSGPGGARVVPVLTATVEKKDVPVWLEGLGTTAAFKQVLVRPQVDGRLDTVNFKEGQVVTRGELLAEIDPRPFSVQLHQAEGALARDQATLLGAKMNLDRYKQLRKDNLVAQQQVDDQAATVGQSEGAVKMDEAQVESARLNLDYARVKSPLDGVVGVRLVDPGNIVHAADPTGIVIVTQLDPAAVFFTLPQDDLAAVSGALAAGDLVVEAWSRDGLQRLSVGKLAVVDNQINQTTSTLKLKAILPNPKRLLWPNQFVKARLLISTEKNALVIPAAAVQRGPQGTFVYLVGGDNIAQPSNVKVDLVTGDLAVIARGVQAGDQVVIEGQNQLRPGTQVSVRSPASDLKKKGDVGKPTDGKNPNPKAAQ